MSTRDPTGEGGGGGDNSTPASTNVEETASPVTPVTPVTGSTVATGSQQQHPPPSPLSGCYLLVVLPEPHTAQHKDLILNRLAKGFLSWDSDSCHVDLEKELLALVAQAPEGEEARNGERLIQYATENLVTEVLIHPQTNTLLQCIRNLLASFTKHRHIIHAGYTFGGNGSWILQDGTFSLADFLDAFSEHEVQRVLRAYENSVTVDIHCACVGDWTTTRLSKESCTRSCRIRVNPDDVLTAGVPAITSFTNYIGQYLVGQTLDQLMEPSDVVGNIRFSHPTLYVFPGGQGDAALFGINGFNMLVDGGFARKACFWDFTRHLDRLDAVLLTRINNSNIGGMSSVLRKKKEMHVYPQIGHFFCNLVERRQSNSPDGDKDIDPLILNLMDIGQEMVVNLRQISLRAHPCYRDPEPINLYHKVGHGTLDMYVLSPCKDSREVREFLAKWHASDSKLFAGSHKKDSNNLTFPVQNMVSICALLVWQPANPEDTITRILFPGSTPQHKIFEGFERLKHLDFLKHPVCSAKSLAPSTSLATLREKPVKQKLSLIEKESKKITDTKKDKKESPELKPLKAADDTVPSKPTPQSTPIIPTKLQAGKVEVKTKKLSEQRKLETEAKEIKKIERDLKEIRKETKKEPAKVDKFEKLEKDDTKKSELIKPETDKAVTTREHKPKAEPKKKDSKDVRPAGKLVKADTTPRPRLVEKKVKPPVEKKDVIKSSPTTPKKTLNGTATKVEISKTAPRTKPAAKAPAGPPPAKSTKDANNRKVVEQKNIEKTALKETAPAVKVSAKPKPMERKPISRRTKPASPSKMRVSGSPAKSTRSTPTTSVKSDRDGVVRKVKGEKGTPDSSTVSTPSGIEPETAVKLSESSLIEKSEDISVDSIESKVLADLKKEREAVEEIEAVFQKAERIEEARKDDRFEGDDEITAEATDKKEDDITEEDVTAEIEDAPKKDGSRKESQELTEEDEYLIVEKEEIYTEDSAISGEGEQKHVLDEAESEKAKILKETEPPKEKGEEDAMEEKEKDESAEKKLAVEPGVLKEDKKLTESTAQKEQLQEEVKDIGSATEVVQKAEEKDDSAKKDSDDITKEPSSLSPDKLDSSEKKTTDTDMKPDIDQKEQVPEKLEESQERISTLESGATTTAPTLPEDERIPLDEIKEVIDEKHVVEEVKEKDVIQKDKDEAALQTVPPAVKPDVTVFDVRQAVQSLQREIVKTPDEVADLPVHEEVDPKFYRMEDFEKAKEEKPLPPPQEVKEPPTPPVKEQKGVFSFFGKVADKFEKGIDKLTKKSRKDQDKDADDKSSSKSGSPKEAKAQEDILPKEAEVKRVSPDVGKPSDKIQAVQEEKPTITDEKTTIPVDSVFIPEEVKDAKRKSVPEADVKAEVQDIDRTQAVIEESKKEEKKDIELQTKKVEEKVEKKGVEIEKDVEPLKDEGGEEDAEEVQALLEEASKKFKTVKDSLRDSLESLEEKIEDEVIHARPATILTKDAVKDTLEGVVEKLEEIKPQIESESPEMKEPEKVKFDIPKDEEFEIDYEDDGEARPVKDVREAVRDVGEVLAGTAGIEIDDKPKDVIEIVKKVAEVLKEDDFLSEKVLFVEPPKKEDTAPLTAERKPSVQEEDKPVKYDDLAMPRKVGVTEVFPSQEEVEELIETTTKPLAAYETSDAVQIHEEPCVKIVKETEDVTAAPKDDVKDKLDAQKICEEMMEKDLICKPKVSKESKETTPEEESKIDVMESGLEDVCVKEIAKSPSTDKQTEEVIEEPVIGFEEKVSPATAELVMVTPGSTPTSPKFATDVMYDTVASKLSTDVKTVLEKEVRVEEIIEELIETKKKITIEVIEYITIIKRIPRERVIYIIEEIIIKKGVPRESVVDDIQILGSKEFLTPQKRKEIDDYIVNEYVTKGKRITIQIIEEISIKMVVPKTIVIEIIEEIVIKRKIARDMVLDVSEEELSKLSETDAQVSEEEKEVAPEKMDEKRKSVAEPSLIKEEKKSPEKEEKAEEEAQPGKPEKLEAEITKSKEELETDVEEEDNLVDGFVSICKKPSKEPAEVHEKEVSPVKPEVSQLAAGKEHEKDGIDDFEAVEEEYKVRDIPAAFSEDVKTLDETKKKDIAEEAVEDIISDVIEADEKIVHETEEKEDEKKAATVEAKTPEKVKESEAVKLEAEKSKVSEVVDATEKYLGEAKEEHDAVKQDVKSPVTEKLEEQEKPILAKPTSPAKEEVKDERKPSLVDAAKIEQKEEKVDEKVEKVEAPIAETQLADATGRAAEPKAELISDIEKAKEKPQEPAEKEESIVTKDHKSPEKEEISPSGKSVPAEEKEKPSLEEKPAPQDKPVTKPAIEADLEEKEPQVDGDSGTVRRMLVTASSEDGGQETEICPSGSITFTKSLTPDDSLKDISIKSTPDKDSLLLDKDSLQSEISTPEKDSISEKQVKDVGKVTPEDSLDKSPGGTRDSQDLEDSLEKMEITKPKDLDTASPSTDVEASKPSPKLEKVTPEAPVSPAEPSKEKEDKAKSPIAEKDEKSKSPVDEKEEKQKSPLDEKAEKPKSPIGEKEEKPKSPVTEKEDKPESPIGEKEEKPKSPMDEKEEKPESPVAAKDEKPKSPVAEKKEEAKSPDAEKEEKSKSPVAEKEEQPKSPVAEKEEKPKSPAAEKEEKPKSPLTEKEEEAKSPVAEKEEQPKSPVTEKEEKPKSPVTEKEEKPKSPVAEKEEKPKSPVAEKEEEAKSPVAEKEEKSKSPVAEKEEQLKSPVPEKEEKPKSPVAEKEEKPKSPVAEKEEEAKSPVAEKEEKSKSPVAEKEEEAKSLVPEKEEKSKSPVAEKEEEAKSPVAEKEEKPKSPVAEKEEKPKSPVSEKEEKPKSPVAEKEEQPKSPVAEKEEKPKSPVAEKEEKPKSPVAEKEEKPKSPIAEEEEKPQSPVAEKEEKPKSPVAEKEEKPKSPIDEKEKMPTSPPEMPDDKSVAEKLSTKLDKPRESLDLTSKTPESIQSKDVSPAETVAARSPTEKEVPLKVSPDKTEVTPSELTVDDKSTEKEKSVTEEKKTPSPVDKIETEVTKKEVEPPIVIGDKDEERKLTDKPAEKISEKKIDEKATKSPDVEVHPQEPKKSPSPEKADLEDKLSEKSLGAGSDKIDEEGKTPRSKSPSISPDSVEGRKPSDAAEEAKPTEIAEKPRSLSIADDKPDKKDVEDKKSPKELEVKLQESDTVSDKLEKVTPTEKPVPESVSDKHEDEVVGASKSPSVADEKETISEKSRSPSIAGEQPDKVESKASEEDAAKSPSPSKSAELDFDKHPSPISPEKQDQEKSRESSKSPSIPVEYIDSKDKEIDHLGKKSPSPSIASDTGKIELVEESKVPAGEVEHLPSETRSPSITDVKLDLKDTAERDKSRSPSITADIVDRKDSIIKEHLPDTITAELDKQEPVTELQSSPVELGKPKDDDKVTKPAEVVKPSSDDDKSAVKELLDQMDVKLDSKAAEIRSPDKSGSEGEIVKPQTPESSKISPVSDTSQQKDVAGKPDEKADVSRISEEKMDLQVTKEQVTEKMASPTERKEEDKTVTEKVEETASGKPSPTTTVDKLEDAVPAKDLKTPAVEEKTSLESQPKSPVSEKVLDLKDVKLPEKEKSSPPSTSLDEKEPIGKEKSPTPVDEAAQQVEKVPSPSSVSEKSDELKPADRSKSASPLIETTTLKDVTEDTTEKPKPEIAESTSIVTEKADLKEPSDQSADKKSPLAEETIDIKDVEPLDKSRSPSVTSTTDVTKQVDESRSLSLTTEVEETKESDVAEQLVDKQPSPSKISGPVEVEQKDDQLKLTSTLEEKHDVIEVTETSKDKPKSPTAVIIPGESEGKLSPGEKPDSKDAAKPDDKLPSPSVSTPKEAKELSDRSKSPSIAEEEQSVKDAGEMLTVKSRSSSVASAPEERKTSTDRSKSPSIAEEKLDTKEIAEDVISKSRSPSVVSSAGDVKDTDARSKSSSLAGEKPDMKDVTVQPTDKSRSPSITSPPSEPQERFDRSKSPSIIEEKPEEEHDGLQPIDKSRSPSVISSTGELKETDTKSSIVDEKHDTKDDKEPQIDKSRSPSIISPPSETQERADRSKSPSIIEEKPGEKHDAEPSVEKSRSPSVISSAGDLKETDDKSSIAGEKQDVKDEKEQPTDKSRSPSVISPRSESQEPIDRSKSPSIVEEKSDGKHEAEHPMDKSRSPSVVSSTGELKDVDAKDAKDVKEESSDKAKSPSSTISPIEPDQSIRPSKSPSIDGDKRDVQDITEQHADKSRSSSLASAPEEGKAPIDRSKSPSIAGEKPDVKDVSDIPITKSRSSSVTSTAGQVKDVDDKSKSPSLAGEQPDVKDVMEPPGDKSMDKSRSPSVISSTGELKETDDKSSIIGEKLDVKDEKEQPTDKSRSPSVISPAGESQEPIDRSKSPSIVEEKSDGKHEAEHPMDKSRSPSVVSSAGDLKDTDDRSSIGGEKQDMKDDQEKLSDKSRSPSVTSAPAEHKELADRRKSSSVVEEKLDIKGLSEAPLDKSRSPSVTSQASELDHPAKSPSLASETSDKKGIAEQTDKSPTPSVMSTPSKSEEPIEQLKSPSTVGEKSGAKDVADIKDVDDKSKLSEEKPGPDSVSDLPIDKSRSPSIISDTTTDATSVPGESKEEKSRTRSPSIVKEVHDVSDALGQPTSGSKSPSVTGELETTKEPIDKSKSPSITPEESSLKDAKQETSDKSQRPSMTEDRLSTSIKAAQETIQDAKSPSPSKEEGHLDTRKLSADVTSEEQFMDAVDKSRHSSIHDEKSSDKEKSPIKDEQVGATESRKSSLITKAQEETEITDKLGSVSTDGDKVEAKITDVSKPTSLPLEKDEKHDIVGKSATSDVLATETPKDRSPSHSPYDTGDKSPSSRSRAGSKVPEELGAEAKHISESAKTLDEKEEVDETSKKGDADKIHIATTKVIDKDLGIIGHDETSETRRPSKVAKAEYEEDSETFIKLTAEKKADIEKYILEEYVIKNRKITMMVIEKIVMAYSVPQFVVMDIIEDVISKRKVRRSSILDFVDEDFEETTVKTSEKKSDHSDSRKQSTDGKVFSEDQYAKDLRVSSKSPSLCSEPIASDKSTQDSPVRSEPHIDEEISISEEKRTEIEKFLEEEYIKKGKKITEIVLEEIIAKTSLPRYIILEIIEEIILKRKLTREFVIDVEIYQEDEPDECYDKEEYRYEKSPERRYEIADDMKKSSYSYEHHGYSETEERQMDKTLTQYDVDYESQFHKAFVGGMQEIRTTHITTLSGKSTPDLTARDDTPDSMSGPTASTVERIDHASKGRASISPEKATDVDKTKPTQIVTVLKESKIGEPEIDTETSSKSDSTVVITKKVVEQEVSEPKDVKVTTKRVEREVIDGDEPETITKIIKREIVEHMEPEIITRVVKREIIEEGEPEEKVKVVKREVVVSEESEPETKDSEMGKKIISEGKLGEAIETVTRKTTKMIITEELQDTGETSSTSEKSSDADKSADVKKIVTTVTTITGPDGKVTTKKDVKESVDSVDSEELLEKLISSSSADRTSKTVTETTSSKTSKIEKITATSSSPDVKGSSDSSSGHVGKSTLDSSLTRDGGSGRSTPDKRTIETPEGFRSGEVIRTTITTTKTVSDDGEIVTTTREVTEATNAEGETVVLAEKTDVKVDERLPSKDTAESTISSIIDSIKSSELQRDYIRDDVDKDTLVSSSKSTTHASSSSEEKQCLSKERPPSSPLPSTREVGHTSTPVQRSQDSGDTKKSHESVEFSTAAMSSSFYSELPDLPSLSFKKFTVEKEYAGGYEEKPDAKKYVDEADLDFEKALMERKEMDEAAESFSSNLVPRYTNGRLTQDTDDSEKDDGRDGVKSEVKKDPLDGWGSPLGLPSPKPPRKFNLKNPVQPSGSSETSSDTLNFDVTKDWGEPLRLPSPAPVTNEVSNKGTPGTPKKEKKQSKKVLSENLKNKKRSESPGKNEKKLKDSKNKVQPVYVDLTYVPHHGNSYYTSLEYFKRVRARYYVFSGTEPSREVYDALLEAKKTWEDKDLEVTMIPTYDTDTLGYWVADNEEALAANHIDLSPSASRCTINLQDHETSCSAYRLEF